MPSTALTKIGSNSLVKAGSAKLSSFWSKLSNCKGCVPAMKATGVAAAGAYGYASSDGTPMQRLERAAGFAAAAGIGVSSTARGKIMSVVNSARETGTVGSAVNYLTTGSRGVMMGAAAGGLYGAMDTETSILGGAAAGAGGMVLARGAARGIAAGHRVGGRTGAAAGGALGFYTGGPVGMAVGAGIGGAVGGGIRMARKFPRTAKYGGAAALVTGGSAAIVGGAAAQAYAMHQRPQFNNFGADGDLALGLHSLRHG